MHLGAWHVSAGLRCVLATHACSGASWTCCDVDECVVWGVRALCDGVERCCFCMGVV